MPFRGMNFWAKIYGPPEGKPLLPSLTSQMSDRFTGKVMVFRREVCVASEGKPFVSCHFTGKISGPFTGKALVTFQGKPLSHRRETSGDFAGKSSGKFAGKHLLTCRGMVPSEGKPHRK